MVRSIKFYPLPPPHPPLYAWILYRDSPLCMYAGGMLYFFEFLAVSQRPHNINKLIYLIVTFEHVEVQ